MLTYAKNAADLARGKKHGSMDIGMSVISTKAVRRRVDIDADASIVHLKVHNYVLMSSRIDLLSLFLI